MSTNDRSFRTNASQRSFLSDSMRTSDYLRASNYSQRKNIDPSSNPYKMSPYGLTGAKLQESPIVR